MNVRLEEKIDSIKKLSIEELCEMFNCKPNEICLDDYIASNTNDKVCPYKVILGFANFENSEVLSLGKLQIVYGKKIRDSFGKLTDIRHQEMYLGLNIKNSKITNLGNLREVYGSITLNNHIVSMDNVEYLGSNLYCINSNLASLGNLREIDGVLNLEDDDKKCQLKTLGGLKVLRRLYINTNSILDIGDIESIKSVVFGTKCNDRIRKLFDSFISKRHVSLDEDMELENVESVL